jgi:thiosulfate/3-mercaptopyruvate sulfurtransferase
MGSTAMPGSAERSLVDTDWLAQHLDDAGVRIVDATWHMPAVGRAGREDFEAGHIPGAVFWDIDAVADARSPLPHMLPEAADFARHMEGFRIGDGTQVVIYDAYGLMTAARPWWMLRYFGHDRVAVLDGGMPKWRAGNRTVETGAAPAPAAGARFTPRPRPDMVHALDQVRGIVAEGAGQVLDARSAGRFAGTEPEPRPNCRSGHIPGSLSLPFGQLLDPETKCVRPPDALRAVFAQAGVDPARPVTTTCGSGVTACALALGLHLTGHDEVAVYDGSWSEWGGRTDTPVEV